MSNPRKLSDASLSSESSESDTQDVLTGEPAPAYDDAGELPTHTILIADHSKYHAEGAGFDSVAQVNSQGQVDLWLDLSKPLPPLPLIPPPSRKHTLEDAGQLDCPPLNIVIFVVGSRGMSGRVLTDTRRRTAVSGTCNPFDRTKWTQGTHSNTLNLQGPRPRRERHAERQERQAWPIGRSLGVL